MTMPSDTSLDDIMGSIAVGRRKLSLSDLEDDFDFDEISHYGANSSAKKRSKSASAVPPRRPSPAPPKITLTSTFEEDIDAVMAEIQVPKAAGKAKKANSTINKSFREPQARPAPAVDMADLFRDISDVDDIMADIDIKPKAKLERAKKVVQPSSPTLSQQIDDMMNQKKQKPKVASQKKDTAAWSPGIPALRSLKNSQPQPPQHQLQQNTRRADLSSSIVQSGFLEDPFCDEIDSSPPPQAAALNSSPYFPPKKTAGNLLNLPNLPVFDFSSQASQRSNSDSLKFKKKLLSSCDLESDLDDLEDVVLESVKQQPQSCDSESTKQDTKQTKSPETKPVVSHKPEPTNPPQSSPQTHTFSQSHPTDLLHYNARDVQPTSTPFASSQIEWEPSSRELCGYDVHTLNLRQKAKLKEYGHLSPGDMKDGRVKRFKSEGAAESTKKQAVLETAKEEPAEEPRKNKSRRAKSESAPKVLRQLEFFNKSNRPQLQAGLKGKGTKKSIQSRLYTTVNNPTLVDVDGEEDGLMTVQVASLSAEQQAIHDLVINGETNIFFTGAAGTGKSVLLRQIIASLRRKHNKSLDRVAVTASTGLAACNIQGTTLHSFAGCGLAREDVDSLCKRIRRNKKARDRWKNVSVLVIDEISMVDARFFDKLEQIAQKLRRNKRPFGGIQLIVTGDFYQLPPVPDTNKDRFQGSYGGQKSNTGMVDSRSIVNTDPEALFAFEAESWSTVIESTFLLTKVFRQKDPTFANMLNQLRTQSLEQSSLDGFMSLARPISVPDGIIPTELFPTRREVDRSNYSKLSTLKGKTYTFDALETGSAEREYRDKLLENIMVPKKLTLKAGAQVMMLKNMDPNLVNGSIGVVVGFMSPQNFVVAENAADLDIIREKPSKRPNIYDVSNESELNQLNRLIETGRVVGESSQASEESDFFSSPAPKESDCVFERLKAFPEDSENATFLERKLQRRKQLEDLTKNNLATSGAVYPVVRFRRMDHTFRNVLLHPETFSVENIEGEVLASRTQIPLILAWALSIHKAQGQTLQYVKVDLAKTFERGQAYVALSRATSKEGLQVLNFLPEKVKTHPKVVEFYKTLTTYDDEPQEVQQENVQPMRAVG
ncbi:ATP-dependent DNA helicase PIF1 [Yarrowia sp. C11]|nr:ATP-dependent DNA helicase PIF1 [Yarrowia sp. E02]KAG5372807.1 ATP-dependent DNA helicase PIF1 [Yarrowia sp. C11]